MGGQVRSDQKLELFRVTDLGGGGGGGGGRRGNIVYNTPKVIGFCNKSYMSKVNQFFYLFCCLTFEKGRGNVSNIASKPMAYIESAITNRGTVLQEERIPSVALITIFFLC